MPETDLKKELELIKRVKSGDREAFEALVKQLSEKIYSLCFQITGDSAIAEDLTHEIFLNVHRHIIKFEQKSSFDTWVKRIAVNILGKAGYARDTVKSQEIPAQAMPEGFHERFNKKLDKEIEGDLELLQKPRYDWSILLKGLVIFLAFVLVVAMIKYLAGKTHQVKSGTASILKKMLPQKHAE